MSKVCVIRHQGYIKSLSHLPCKHNFRTAKNYKNKNIDSSLTKNNTTILYNLQENETYLRAFKRLYENKEFQGQLKVQGEADKQTKFLDEFLIYPPNEIINAMSLSEQNDFFKEEIKALQKYFPNMIILSANIHRDEIFQPLDESMQQLFPTGKITPHMHVTAIPVVHDKKSGMNKISISQLWHGKNSYGKFQDFMYESVGKKYGFERGEIHELGKSQKHLEIETYKQQEQLKSIYSQEVFIAKKEQELLKRSESIEPNTKITPLNIKSVIREQQGINIALKKANDDITVLEQKYNNLEIKAKEIDIENRTLKGLLFKKENELEEEKSLIDSYFKIKINHKDLRKNKIMEMLSNLPKYEKLVSVINNFAPMLKRLCPSFMKELSSNNLLDDKNDLNQYPFDIGIDR